MTRGQKLGKEMSKISLRIANLKEYRHHPTVDVCTYIFVTQNMSFTNFRAQSISEKHATLATYKFCLTISILPWHARAIPWIIKFGNPPYSYLSTRSIGGQFFNDPGLLKCASALRIRAEGCLGGRAFRRVI